MLRRINPVLPELLAGIGLYGLVVQFAGMWFAADQLQYALGLWIGIILAMGMAVNMAVVILDTVDAMAVKGTAVRAGLWPVLRYVVVAGVVACAWYFEVGNPLAMFLGVMGLKVSAYLQPFLHKLILQIKKKSAKRGDGPAN